MEGLKEIWEAIQNFAALVTVSQIYFHVDNRLVKRIANDGAHVFVHCYFIP